MKLLVLIKLVLLMQNHLFKTSSYGFIYCKTNYFLISLLQSSILTTVKSHDKRIENDNRYGESSKPRLSPINCLTSFQLLSHSDFINFPNSGGYVFRNFISKNHLYIYNLWFKIIITNHHLTLEKQIFPSPHITLVFDVKNILDFIYKNVTDYENSFFRSNLVRVGIKKNKATSSKETIYDIEDELKLKITSILSQTKENQDVSQTLTGEMCEETEQKQKINDMVSNIMSMVRYKNLRMCQLYDFERQYAILNDANNRLSISPILVITIMQLYLTRQLEYETKLKKKFAFLDSSKLHENLKNEVYNQILMLSELKIQYTKKLEYDINNVEAMKSKQSIIANIKEKQYLYIEYLENIEDDFFKNLKLEQKELGIIKELINQYLLEEMNYSKDNVLFRLDNFEPYLLFCELEDFKEILSNLKAKLKISTLEDSVTYQTRTSANKEAFLKYRLKLVEMEILNKKETYDVTEMYPVSNSSERKRIPYTKDYSVTTQVPSIVSFLNLYKGLKMNALKLLINEFEELLEDFIVETEQLNNEGIYNHMEKYSGIRLDYMMSLFHR